jgi:hypothetical protein
LFVLSNLSPPAKRVYQECAADLGDLIHAWTTFLALVQDAAVADTLNRASPRFFGAVEAALRTYSVTLVAKLLERPMVAGKKTAGLEVLLAECVGDEAARAELLRELGELRTSADSVIEYRHKRVVHTDYAVRADGADSKIPSVGEFDGVVRGLRAFMRRLEQSAGLPTIPYENSNGRRDAHEMVRLLEAGLSAG